MAMGDIVRRTAKRFPNRTALILGEDSLTYDEFNRRVNRLAHGFLGLNLAKGDRVAVLSHNSIEFFEVYMALCKSGGVMVPINNLLRERELSQIFGYIKPRFVVFSADFSDTVKMLMETEGSSLETAVCIGGDCPSWAQDYEKLLAGGSEDEPDVQVDDEDLMSIILTSGTTGLPKGALRTHRLNIMNSAGAAIETSMVPDDRVLLLFPFYHVTFEDRLCHLLLGNTMVIRKQGNFNPKEVLELLSKHRITMCQFVPTMLNSMLQDPDIEKYDLSSLRLIMYAAAPMPVELLKAAMRRFKCQFIQHYGQTEAGPMITNLRPEDHVVDGDEKQLARLASCGRAAPFAEVKVVDESDQELPVGQVGELLVRSEHITKGYWDLPEETAKTLAGGWLHTGDFARKDQDGYFYIVDRKNDMIISGGKNIYPREVEEVLYAHPAVLETSVFGVPDDHWGESVMAVVVLKKGAQATAEDITAHCKENLASYKKPRFVEFRDELPKSAAGKILKRVLRDEYWKERERAV